MFLVLLDLSAAFDTVSHEVLLSRLRLQNGINGNALQWISSYLHDRSQSVLVAGNLSEAAPLKWGVPQGSVLGPDLFSDYSAPVANIIRSYGVTAHCYADDTQLDVTFSPGDNESEVLDVLERCIDELRLWMTANKLKLNDSKTEFIIFGSATQIKKVSTSCIHIGEHSIPSSRCVRNIGAFFDEQMKMENQVKQMCKSTWHHLFNISKIREYLTTDQAKSLIHAYVTSKLDMNNALLSGAPQFLISKLQIIQNCAAKIISQANKFDHATPILRNLHWLPVAQRIVFKLLLLTFKALSCKGPDYLRELLIPYQPSRSLRSSSDHHLLVIPKTKLKTYGDKAFSAAAPVLWNNLPFYIRSCQSVISFKSALKTHLFKSSLESL